MSSMMKLFLAFPVILSIFFLVRLILYRTALIYAVRRLGEWVDDKIHVHQFFKVPEFNENGQENQLFKKVLSYLNSLASLEDSDYTSLFAGKKPNDVVLCLDENQVVRDGFLGSRLSWTNRVEGGENRGRRSFVLRIKKKDKRRILQPYLQHIHTVSDDTERRSRELTLYVNCRPSDGRWRSVPFDHPSSFETIVMDQDLKNRVKSDLESFVKSRQYYHKLGRVWKRSYLLYGPSGTGKSSFVAAMANFLSYDVYDVDLSEISDDSDLKMLLMQTNPKSLIVIEDLDRFLAKSTSVSLSGMLNFMDGLITSCCGDERVMVFTVNNKDQIDPAILRPGRIDVHLYFPLCDFNSFKNLASSYLGLKEHKLFPQVEEIFQTGATMSQAEIGELMLAHRSSPSRALKSVMAALQSANDGRKIAATSRRASDSSSYTTLASEDFGASGVWKDAAAPVAKEFRKLYGMLRMKSCKRPDAFDHDYEMIQR